ncbi:MAG: hypothetical protein KC438_06525 [Thermomicrobiales bacterium]|nr:hypothetical protein [Thermomicrobiales bacterium]
MDASDNQIRRIVVDRMDRCAVCHRRFVEDDVEVVSRKSDVWLMIVQCRDCHSRSFAAVVGDNSAPIDTDSLFGFASGGSVEITFETDGEFVDIEPETESLADPVGVDDLLEMHEFLDTFDGDFKLLFEREARE